MYNIYNNDKTLKKKAEINFSISLRFDYQIFI